MDETKIPYRNYPDSYRAGTIKEIAKIIGNKDSLLLTGLPGSGVTSLLRQLEYSPITKKFNFHFLDLNVTLIIGLENITNLSLTLVGLTKQTPRPIIVIDPIERLLESGINEFPALISGLRRQAYGEFCFIFGSTRVIDRYYPIDLILPYTKFIFENQIYLPLLSEEEAAFTCLETAKQYCLKIDQKTMGRIFELSGGYTQTIKRLVQALNRGNKLKQLEANPAIDIHLNYHFQQILEALKPEVETLRLILSGQANQADNGSIEILKKLSVIDNKLALTSPLFKTFLQLNLSVNNNNLDTLTAKEEKLLTYLKSNEGVIRSRDEIINFVWGEEGGQEINNHALDQLIHRLKSKLSTIKPEIGLEIYRGKGIKLITR